MTDERLARVTVLGAGTMGSGIGQVTAMAGHETVLRDVDERQLVRAREAIALSLRRLRNRERMTDAGAEAVMARLQFTTVADEALAAADVVIESVPEVPALKQQVLQEAVAHAPSHALIASNTSQLSITSLAASVDSAAPRFLGMHFFNPPVLMRLVELIRGLQTSDETLERARRFASALGKEIVVCRKDSPGFITSRAYAILRLECLRMLEEGVGTAEDIDRALKLAFNLPMGPFELGDFNGLDTYLHALAGLEEAYGERFRPTVGLRNMVAAKRMGRKTGHGFYRYDPDGNRLAEETGNG